MLLLDGRVHRQLVGDGVEQLLLLFALGLLDLLEQPLHFLVLLLQQLDGVHGHLAGKGVAQSCGPDSACATEGAGARLAARSSGADTNV